MINYTIVPTGKIIKEYLDEYNISQKDLSKRIGSSERHLSNLLNGKTRITEDFAIKLEKILTNVPASYWLNYETKYREQLARIEEETRLSQYDLSALSKLFNFAEVFKGLNLSLYEQAIEMLKLLKISSFENFNESYYNLRAAFMEDGGEIESIAVWLNLCESELYIQNENITDNEFTLTDFTKDLPKLKEISLNENIDRSIVNCRRFLNSHGIYLVFVDAIKNSKVRGALTSINGKPAIYISGRFKTHDHIWFAILHEIGHLVLHYNKKDTIISYEGYDVSSTLESESNEFARNFFLPSGSLRYFENPENISNHSILKFSKTHDVLPGMVVAWLQHDGLIDYSEYNHHKIKLIRD